MRIKIVWVGKTKHPQIQALAADYLARLKHLVSCEILEARDPGRGRNLRGDSLRAAESAQLLKLTEGLRRIVVLDERGRQFSSPEFATWLQGEQNRGSRDVAFVIGGPEGISATVSERAALSLSLGRMTWTHEMCRALLLEQIYRAFSILKNIPYHK
jgi:23S rRNA (pseudouridine1915-N3)-methyltransferase